MSTKTRLECPDCKKRFNINGRYDVNTDVIIMCPHCEFAVSKWCFEFVTEREGR